jgi:hypothetical protein
VPSINTVRNLISIVLTVRPEIEVKGFALGACPRTLDFSSPHFHTRSYLDGFYIPLSFKSIAPIGAAPPARGAEITLAEIGRKKLETESDRRVE